MGHNEHCYYVLVWSKLTSKLKSDKIVEVMPIFPEKLIRKNQSRRKKLHMFMYKSTGKYLDNLEIYLSKSLLDVTHY